MIKAVIFDMDGLITDSEPLWDKAKEPVLKSVGIEVNEELAHQHRGRVLKENIAELYHEKPWQGISQEQVVAAIIQELIRLTKSEGKLMPGAQAALSLCAQQKLPMALASSSPSELINAVMDKFKLRHYFKVIYSAENEPFGKPHPGVFISAAKELKVVPHQCLVLEDAPSGVLAAKAAKMHCIAVPQADLRNDPFVNTADIVLDSLKELTPQMLHSL